jgi:hypothetical protein
MSAEEFQARLKYQDDSKGEKVLIGSKKEGLKKGGLAGAISLIIPIHS